MSQLPDYLRTSKRGRLAERAAEGMGSLLPPHVSIKGNRFTLIDQSGGQKPIDTLYLDVCVADMSDKMAKLYYGKDYDPGTSDPPLCWSPNGVVPSKDAVAQQNPDCASCPHNRIGSAVSKLSGKPIKACRDEKWLAVIPIGVPGAEKMLFQFRVTPGSFKNFKGYSEKFKGREVDMKDVTTRLTFDPEANGVVVFATEKFLPPETAQVRELAYEKNSTDVFVGRADGPAQLAGTGGPAPAALAAPATIVTNTPRPGDTPEQGEARKTRGRPKKGAVEQAQEGTRQGIKDAQQNITSNTPFATGPTSAPFGIQADAPSPPNEIAEGMKSFFDE